MKYKVLHQQDAVERAESIFMQKEIPYCKKYLLSLLRERNSNGVGLKHFASAKGKPARYVHYHIVETHEGDFEERLLKAVEANPYLSHRSIEVDDSNLIMPEGG